MKKTSKGLPQLKNKIQKDFLMMLDEAIPVAQNERKKYVSDIALFYQSVFKKKLQHFIGLQLLELAQIGRTELGTNIIRSNISCLRIIDEWFEERSNEHFGNLEEIRDSLSDGDLIINDLKKKYGEI
jgi:hypothetical protein